VARLARFGWWILAGVLVLASSRTAEATTFREVPFPLRGKTLTLTIYYPARQPLGTIFMGSGDVGWVGLAVSTAEYLSDNGYLVIGVNVRQYLGVFTDGRKHLTVADLPSDFRAMAEFLRSQHLLFSPVIMSGVSEGAALAVAAASDPRNHDWIDGVVTMGIPRVAELAWKWTDFTSWITKKDADEPSFKPYEYMAGIAPVPLVMIQSRKDEYVPESDYQECHANAKEPKKLVLIDASNHRFTDRKAELRREYLGAVKWVLDARAVPGVPKSGAARQ